MLQTKTASQVLFSLSIQPELAVSVREKRSVGFFEKGKLHFVK